MPHVILYHYDRVIFLCPTLVNPFTSTASSYLILPYLILGGILNKHGNKGSLPFITVSVPFKYFKKLGHVITFSCK